VRTGPRNRGPSPGGTVPSASTGLLVGATLLLFGIWSNTFLAFEVLLAPRAGPAPLGWRELLLARYLPTAAIAGAWLLLFRRAETAAVLREHPVRLLLSALFAVPGYNALLYDGMQHRVEGPVASVLTSLVPLYLLVLGALFLGERLTARRAAGFLVGLAGVVLIATAKETAGASRALRVAEVALAPLCWSIHSALTKPVASRHPPVVWTFLVLAAGGVLLLPLVPGADGERLAALDGRGVALLAYLVLPATVFGFALWSWLLRHLPAGTVGLTVFLNPPMTLASKALLAALLPASFALTVVPREWLGGALALGGVALAILRPRGGR
jgi:drug/metabolite transporter (DMT)-like permease